MSQPERLTQYNIVDVMSRENLGILSCCRSLIRLQDVMRSQSNCENHCFSGVWRRQA